MNGSGVSISLGFPSQNHCTPCGLRQWAGLWFPLGKEETSHMLAYFRWPFEVMVVPMTEWYVQPGNLPRQALGWQTRITEQVGHPHGCSHWAHCSVDELGGQHLQGPSQPLIQHSRNHWVPTTAPPVRSGSESRHEINIHSSHWKLKQSDLAVLQIVGALPVYPFPTWGPLLQATTKAVHRLFCLQKPQLPCLVHSILPWLLARHCGLARAPRTRREHACGPG